MTNQEVAARLLVLEHRAQDLISEVRMLVHDVLDSIEQDEVD